MILKRCEWGHDDYSLNVANFRWRKKSLNQGRLKTNPPTKPNLPSVKVRSKIRADCLMEWIVMNNTRAGNISGNLLNPESLLCTIRIGNSAQQAFKLLEKFE